VTEGIEPLQTTGEPPRSARELLTGWANQQDGWIRAIVGEVVSTRREMSVDAITAAKDRYLIEKQLAEGESAAVPAIGVPNGNGDPGEGLRLMSLRSCRGVNALAEDQEISFHPRLTVLFGENAAGKTGYVRVLKRIANVRSAEPIIPDIHRPSSSGEPEALIRYALGDTEYEVTWRGEAGLSPFTRMTVFDSPAVALHLEGSVTYVFTPADLALFRYSHSAIEAVRAQLEEEASARQPRQNPFLTAFTRGTAVYAEIEALGAGTDLARLDELAAVSEADLAELDALRISVEALSSATSAGRRDALKTRSAVLQHLITLAEVVSAFDADAYAEAIRAAGMAQDAHAEAADAVYSDGQLPAELRPVWQAFLEAGERFLAASGMANYPEAEDECIYCGQKLEAASRALIRAYREYASGATTAAVAEARERVAAVAARLVSQEVGTAIQTLGALLPGLEEDVDAPEWVSDGRRLVDYVSALGEAVVQGRPEPSTTFPPDEVRRLQPQLAAAATQAQETLRTLEGDAAEQARVLTEDRARIAAFESRQNLARLLPDIRSYAEGAAWASKLRTLLARFPGLLRSLTEASKVASEEILNRDFERVFYQECAALRAPTVTLDFPGRRGEASRRKSVAADHTITAILSQGEQKVIAIADFLAETSLRAVSAPIVFDDPVDSFDHRRVGEIAKRIADLADEHQVVVFSHDIMFAANLLSHFEDRRADCAYFQVTEDQGRKGIVSKATHARLDTLNSIRSRMNEAIQAAQGAGSGERQDLIDGAYDHIRAWCEVAVETKLLAKVTQRYQPNVAMQELGRIRTDRLGPAITTIYPIWEKANRYIPGHSQPLVTLGVRPTLDELRGDWAALQQALRDYEAD
jgi:hypothetical protein